MHGVGWKREKERGKQKPRNAFFYSVFLDFPQSNLAPAVLRTRFLRVIFTVFYKSTIIRVPIMQMYRIFGSYQKVARKLNQLAIARTSTTDKFGEHVREYGGKVGITTGDGDLGGGVIIMWAARTTEKAAPSKSRRANLLTAPAATSPSPRARAPAARAACLIEQ